MQISEEKFKNPETLSILVDFTRCVGCDECWMACEKENDWGRPEKENYVTDKGEKKERKVAGKLRPEKLNKNVLTTLTVYGDGFKPPDEKQKEAFENIDEQFGIRRFCMHCIDPACASVCVSRAMRKDDSGPVKYNASVCLGCRYCMTACPFGIPKYEYEKFAPRVRKCFMCQQRTIDGKPNTKDVDEKYRKWPACAAACVEANGKEAATQFFENRNDALKEAHKRIADNPDKYFDHVYGETEYGGTGVLMLTAKGLEFNDLPGFIKPLYPGSLKGFNKLEKRLPEYSGTILGALPGVIGMCAVTLVGFWWFCNRRDEVQAEEGNKH